MLTATLLALAAAVLHAAWNLAIKHSPIDRFTALWGQFTLAAAVVGPAVFAFGGMPARAWVWVAVSGVTHLPYCWFLAKAYERGDFSLVYPVARGGGAMLAALGGVALLGDRLSWLSAAAVGVVGLGLVLLAGRADRRDIASALIVAVTIGIYSVADAKGIRTSGTPLYAFATVLGVATTTTAFNVARGKSAEMARALRTEWRRLALIGAASTTTYAMVQLAFRSAPVGYVTALRESSVVLAAYIGWRRLGEHAGRRRLAASMLVLAGLVLLVLSRSR